MDEHEPVSLSIHHRPLAVSIASIDGGQFLLIDPTPLEEAVADGVLTVCMNGHGEICCINSGGGTPLSKSQVWGIEPDRITIYCICGGYRC
eukprot:m.50523 g.50523  ORF g.50523 m.50523 type:complete len:91 (-) comp13428_c0_seq4:285-557(-)